MQFQADVIGRPVVRNNATDISALGAAYLAGLGAGVWRSLNEVERRWALERRFAPRVDETTRAARYDGWRRAVERAKAWVVP